MSSTPNVSVREWTDVVRRARLGKTTKYIALMLATYADYSNGRRAYPGIARISTACEVSYNTVKAALRALREAGLVELMVAANSRGQADEYRLVLAEDLLERVEVVSPAAMDVAVDRIRAARRGTYVPRLSEGLRPVGSTAETDLRHVPRTAEDQESGDLRAAGEAADGKPAVRPTYADSESAARLTNDLRYAPRPPTTHSPNTTTTSHSDQAVETAGSGPRARAPDKPDSSLPEKCAHGLASRLRADGKPSCTLCRRGVAKPPANVVQLRPRLAPEAS